MAPTGLRSGLLKHTLELKTADFIDSFAELEHQWFQWSMKRCDPRTEWVQQIPGTTSKISIQKSAVLRTAKDTAEASARGPKFAEKELKSKK